MDGYPTSYSIGYSPDDFDNCSAGCSAGHSCGCSAVCLTRCPPLPVLPVALLDTPLFANAVFICQRCIYSSMLCLFLNAVFICTPCNYISMLGPFLDDVFICWRCVYSQAFNRHALACPPAQPPRRPNPSAIPTSAAADRLTFSRRSLGCPCAAFLTLVERAPPSPPLVSPLPSSSASPALLLPPFPVALNLVDVASALLAGDSASVVPIVGYCNPTCPQWRCSSSMSFPFSPLLPMSPLSPPSPPPLCSPPPPPLCVLSTPSFSPPRSSASSPPPSPAPLSPHSPVSSAPRLLPLPRFLRISSVLCVPNPPVPPVVLVLLVPPSPLSRAPVSSATVFPI